MITHEEYEKAKENVGFLKTALRNSDGRINELVKQIADEQRIREWYQESLEASEKVCMRYEIQQEILERA